MRYGAPKRKIGIEDLLTWAYRDQMVHAARPEGEPVELLRNDYVPGFAVNAMGDKVDTGGIKIAFAAHADAYAVDRAVAKLGVAARARSAEEIAILTARRMLRNELAVRHHGTVGDYSQAATHETVHLSALVRQYALKGERPYVIADPHYEYERAGTVRKPNRHEAWYCAVRPIGDDPLEVEQLKAKYALWRESLWSVRGALEGKLNAHEVLDYLPPAV